MIAPPPCFKHCVMVYADLKSDDPAWAKRKERCKGSTRRIDPGESASVPGPNGTRASSNWRSVVVTEKGSIWKISIYKQGTDHWRVIKGTTTKKRTCINIPNPKNKFVDVLIKVYDPDEHRKKK